MNTEAEKECESGASCSVSKKVIGAWSKGHTSHLEDTPTGQTWDDLSVKGNDDSD